MRRGVSVRAVALGLAVVGAALLAVLATRGLASGTVYYYTPSEAPAHAEERVMRVGGRVVPGSIRWDGRAGVLHFALTDGRAVVRVANRGAPPALFAAGRPALVEGRLTGGLLRSSQVIVKHDERYRPPVSARAGKARP